MTFRTLIALSLAFGCSGESRETPPPMAAGGSAAGGDTQTGGTANAVGGGSTAPCPDAAPPNLPGAGSRVDLPIEITVQGTPVVVGEPAAGRDGREYRLSLFKFFLSQPRLVGSDGSERAAQIVGADGVPLPYGLQLVDADDAASQVLRLSAASGDYTALRLGVGIPAACNAMASTSQVYPLNPDSDMFWTWGSQFIFLRIEGSTRADATSEWGSLVYHVGYDPAFANLSIPGTIEVGSAATGPTLSLDIDLMLAADGELPESQHNVPNGWVMDNLESNQAFTLR